ncbi:type II toxin-antitoxin system VapC family toxin [Limnohabitans sp.]|uniref:type II toxin-antitoxin system VapC family toxin n=1 Tax=Limnohabitans sp. TaxID=1907725 RepID=UPI00286F6C21|nr:type II toxin-antitoxin system VapC family toxin [Limnohabitans sp.]
MVLDTNVVSELMRPEPDVTVLAWLNNQPADTLWLNSVVVSELLYGIARLPDGKRRAQLALAVQAMLAEDFAGCVLPFDLEAAVVYADLVAMRERQRQPIDVADAQIAAICLAHGATLITRNTKHFEGVGLTLMNPWVA